MAYGNKITTSKHGRRLGLQAMSTAETGGSRAEFLVGPDEFRVGVSTAETTSANLKPYGISHIIGTSVDSSSVFVLEAPIPGVTKTLYFGSTGNTACYVKTAGGETIHSTIGSSHTTIKSTVGGMCMLTGVTTAKWASLGITSGTSVAAGGFTVSATT